MNYPELTLDLLEACVRRCIPGTKSMAFHRIPTGKFNTSYFVDADDLKLVLRIAPPEDSVFVFYERGMMKQEPEIHDLLLMGPRIPVAPIIAFDDSHTIIDRDFLLMERLPGQPMCDASNFKEDVILQEVGDCLAQTHQLTAKSYGYLGPHRPMEPQSTWQEAFVIMWRKLVDDIVSVGYYDDAERTYMLTLLESHLALFDRRVPASLLHMDIWQQNILVSEHGVLTGIVDWDRALWGDPEIEFAVLDYCGISTPAFWDGYGQTRDTSLEAKTRNTFYLLYEIQKYIVIKEGRERNPQAAQQYKHQVMQFAKSLH